MPCGTSPNAGNDSGKITRLHPQGGVRKVTRSWERWLGLRAIGRLDCQAYLAIGSDGRGGDRNQEWSAGIQPGWVQRGRTRRDCGDSLEVQRCGETWPYQVKELGVVFNSAF